MDNNNTNIESAGLWRRFGSLMYDTIVLLAIYLLSTVIFVGLRHGRGIPPETPWYEGYLILLTALFYIGFWLRRGQTLGKLAWQLFLVTEQGKRVSLWQAILRFIIAIPSVLCFGIGFFWMIFDKENRTLYDRLSKTRVVKLKEI